MGEGKNQKRQALMKHNERHCGHLHHRGRVYPYDNQDTSEKDENSGSKQSWVDITERLITFSLALCSVCF